MPNGVNIVLDAKWKRPKNGQPAPGDLRQLFAYSQHYKAAHAFLLYPCSGDEAAVVGKFRRLDHLLASKQEESVNCSTMFVRVGSGQAPTDTGVLDEDGYLRCSLGTILEGLVSIDAKPTLQLG